MASEYQPLVTIITPTYNQASFLEETIQSVLNQTYQNIEYIIINDGSTDDTEKVLDKYRDDVRCITQENIGQSATINKGWSLAMGEYVSYLSSDDLLYKDAVFELVSKILKIKKSNKKAALVYGNYHIINERGDLKKTFYSKEYSAKDLQVNLICQPGLLPLFDKIAFDYFSGWDVDLHQVPDFDFWLRLSSKVDFFHLNKFVGAYRVHSGSSSFSVMSNERANEIIYVTERFYKKYGSDSFIKSQAISNSYLIASKNHLQSKRYAMGIVCWFSAFKRNKNIVFSFTSYRMLFSGLLRRYLD